MSKKNRNVSQLPWAENLTPRELPESTVATTQDDQGGNKPMSKRQHRYFPEQINRMEEFFKDFTTHPDEMQRFELSKAVGLTPLQVKYWFQNKRTRIMAQEDKEKLLAENIRLKEALHTYTKCRDSSSIIELSEEEIDRILRESPTMKVEQPHPLVNASTVSCLLIDQQGVGNDIFTKELLEIAAEPSETKNPLVFDIAVRAMQELLKMAEAGYPLWFPGYDTTQVLSKEVYIQAFAEKDGLQSLELRTEATRETAIVMMNPMCLVEILMNLNQWLAMFSSIVPMAMPVGCLKMGAEGDYNGSLQVILANYQVLSPLVPLRKNLIARYCVKDENGTWAVVDASLDILMPNSTTCRRRPSGCIIKEMPNGYSQVTWVEHVEVDDSSTHELYKYLIESGLAFGAKHWVSILTRQCCRIASTVAQTFPSGNNTGTSVVASKSSLQLLMLAERMMINFSTGVTGSALPNYSFASGEINGGIKITIRKDKKYPGGPVRYVITAATSLWLPVNPRRLFEFLFDASSRPKWDIMSVGVNLHEITHIATGPEQGNRVSLLRGDDQNYNLLQESSFNATGSYLVYAPLDSASLNGILRGENTDSLLILPSGFAILPDGPSALQGGKNGEPGKGGTLLTMAFQILLDSPVKSDFLIRTHESVSRVITATTSRISTAIAML